jgi:flagellar motor switch protein FliN/FliY
MKTKKIQDVMVPLDVVIGSTEKSVKDLAGLQSGLVIELESVAGEPVELRAAGQVVAFGEVVVIDENFGIRITDVISKED